MRCVAGRRILEPSIMSDHLPHGVEREGEADMAMKAARFAALAATFLFLPTVGVMATEPSPIEASGVVSEELRIDRSNWDAPGNTLVSFTRTERIFPTTRMKKASTVQPLTAAPGQLDIRKTSVNDPLTGRPIPIAALLTRISNEGLIVIHRGRVVHESYRNGFDRDTRHILMSTTKSFTGMLAGIALEEGQLDAAAPVGRYVAEVSNLDAWQDITLRHVMDMRSGLRYTENYGDPDSDVSKQERAVGWRPLLNENDVQGALPWVAQSLTTKDHPVGVRFNYNSSLTNVLARAIETATGNDLATFFEERIWQKLGTEHDAGFGRDRIGFHMAEATMSMTLRDFARGGLLVLAKGRNLRGEQVVPAAFFEDLVKPSEPVREAFAKSDFEAFFAGGSYRSQFWIRDAEKKQVFMMGIHGQSCYVDYPNELVVVTFGAYPVAKDLILVRSIQALWDGVTRAVGAD